MIDSFFTNTCKILREVGNSDDWNNRQEVLFKEDVECLFISKSSVVTLNDRSETIFVSGTLQIREKILETDKIVLDDGYEYEIVLSGIDHQKDLITSEIFYYKAKLSRRELYSETEIEISESDS